MINSLLKCLGIIVVPFIFVPTISWAQLRVDLAFCLDGSGSISSKDFQLQVGGTAAAIENVSVIPQNGSVRITVVQFAETVRLEVSPTIIDSQDVATQVANIVRGMQKINGGTDMAGCIDQATSAIVNAQPPPIRARIIDISTDGLPTDSNATITARDRARDMGIDALNALAVGVNQTGINFLQSLVFPGNSVFEQLPSPPVPPGFVLITEGFDDFGQAIVAKIMAEIVIVSPCPSTFTGTFTGDLIFTQFNPFTGEDEDFVDDTTLNLSSTSPLAGVFNADWLPEATITGVGNTSMFTSNFNLPKCPPEENPGMISGTLSCITSNNIDTIQVINGEGTDCMGDYTFSGTLVREGTGGDEEGGDGEEGPGGDDGSNLGSTEGGSGCSIAQTNTPNPTFMLSYLLPVFIIIRRGWKRFNKKSLALMVKAFYRRNWRKKQLPGNRGNSLLFLVLLPASALVLSLCIAVPVQAQRLFGQTVDGQAVLDVLGSPGGLCLKLQGLEELTPKQQDLLNLCNALIPADQPPSDKRQDPPDPSESEISPIYGVILRLLSNNQFKTIGARLAAVRFGPTAGISIERPVLALNTNEKTFSDTLVAGVSPIIPVTISNQVSADEPSPFGKFGFFATGSFDFGDKDQTQRTTEENLIDVEDGFDFLIFDITAGVDYRFTDNFILGVAFNYTRVDIDIDPFQGSGGGSLDTNGYSGSIYGSLYVLNNLYIDGIASFGWIDYDLERNINFELDDYIVNKKAKGDTNGAYYAFGASAGYDFNIGGFTLGPLARVNYARADIDGFREEIGGEGDGIGLGLDVDSQDVDTLSSALGGQASYAISTSLGVFLPQVLFEWVHEFKDDSRTISSHFLADPTPDENTEIKLQTEDPDRDIFNLGGGISAVFPHGISAFVYYESVLGWEDVTSHYLSGGIRFEL